MEECLGWIIKETTTQGRWTWINLHGEDQATTHQQFVDDTMLMGTPKVDEAHAIKQFLKDFMTAPGTSINQGKSQILFFNTPPTIQTNLAKILGYQISDLPTKYPGALVVANSLKKASWEDLLT
jgi:hypothetical protein